MKQRSTSDFSSIYLYLSIVAGLSSIFYFLIIYTGSLHNGMGLYTFGLMWMPGLSALITLKILKRDFSELGWKWGKTKYQLWSYLVPIIYTLIAYIIIWIAGWGNFYNHDFARNLASGLGFKDISDFMAISLFVLLAGSFGIIQSAANALGEEIGWRGFLVPELYKKTGYFKTSLFSGIIWGIWHLPVLLFADYNSGTPAWFSLGCFMVLITSMGFIYTWFRIKSGSLWTAVILHATHNLYIQNIFTPLTGDTGKTAYFTDEFGIVLPVIGIVFALYFWSRRKELPNPESI